VCDTPLKTDSAVFVLCAILYRLTCITLTIRVKPGTPWIKPRVMVNPPGTRPEELDRQRHGNQSINQSPHVQSHTRARRSHTTQHCHRGQQTLCMHVTIRRHQHTRIQARDATPELRRVLRCSPWTSAAGADATHTVNIQRAQTHINTALTLAHAQTIHYTSN